MAIDPAVAALIGAGIGVGGTIVDKVLSGRRGNVEWSRHLRLERYSALVTSIDGWNSQLDTVLDTYIRALDTMATTANAIVRGDTIKGPVDAPLREAAAAVEVAVQELITGHIRPFRAAAVEVELFASREVRACVDAAVTLWEANTKALSRVIETSLAGGVGALIEASAKPVSPGPDADPHVTVPTAETVKGVLDDITDAGAILRKATRAVWRDLVSAVRFDLGVQWITPWRRTWRRFQRRRLIRTVERVLQPSP